MPNLPTSITPFGRGVKSLPYDAEVEYLQSDGASCIDTGLLANDSLTFEIRASFQADGCTWGAQNGNGTTFPTGWNRFVFGRRYNVTGNNTCFWAFNAEASSPTYYGFSADMSVANTFVLDSVNFSFNGIAKGIRRPTTLNPQFNFHLFGTKTRSSVAQLAQSTCYYAKFSWNGTLARDFIPVRVGSVGYLYDRVSRQLFGNAGEGSFIVGPDKNG